MTSHRHEILILGAGLAGLTAACHLYEQGGRDIAIVTSGLGGTPYIAAFNAVLPDSPHGDTVERYCGDMLAAGYHLGDRALVERLGTLTVQCKDLLERWGVSFSRTEDGGYLLRQASGSSCPRSLCRTDLLVGEHMADALITSLRERGVRFYENTTCTALHTANDCITGVSAVDANGTRLQFTSGCVLAAWGGVGHLYNGSTYPGDIDGRTLAMAAEAGVELIDLEFVEFEPLVSLDPPGARGEPCPTAMLGEGAWLVNSEGERFLLRARPQGEAGAPKSLINQAIWEEVRAGRGSPLGGIWVDLRHLEQKVLESYPWFYNRLKDSGLDVKQELLQVGPMAHSHSGGIRVNLDCMSNIGGLFAAGEAAGGMHGACRMAGNAAAQAGVSGLNAAMGMLQYSAPGQACSVTPSTFHTNHSVQETVAPQVRRVVSDCIGRERNARDLQTALEELGALAEASAADTYTRQLAVSGQLLATAALRREESRGTHVRSDFPVQRDECRFSITLKLDGEQIRTGTVAR